jgi:hypothetical protein
MNAGSKISGNYGNGVYVEYSTFAMKGGAVSGNSASSSSYDGGGGVYVGGGSTFTRQWRGGTIYGSDANSALKNTATDGDAYGHAVYVETSPARVRNTTAGSSIDMDSAQAGSTGGWE